MTEQLLRHIRQLLPGFVVPEEELHPCFRTRTLKKGELLLKEAEPCNNLYFVNRDACVYSIYTTTGKQSFILLRPLFLKPA